VRLILASASPRRAELLRAAGFEFEMVVTDVDERVHADETPARYVRRLAAEKSYVASGLCRPSVGRSQGRYEQDSIILAADTTVVVDGRILGKPADDGDAARMLRALAGGAHEVLTGLSVRCLSTRADGSARSGQATYEVGRVETTKVYFAPISDADVAWYVASGEGRDKAGGYAIQGLASRFIPRIEGSYSNVVGLPVAAVVELLRECGVNAL
jgi:septum formation protein